MNSRKERKQKLISTVNADELLGYFNQENDKGDFVLDLKQAKEDRAEEIMNKLKKND